MKAVFNLIAALVVTMFIKNIGDKHCGETRTSCFVEKLEVSLFQIKDVDSPKIILYVIQPERILGNPNFKKFVIENNSDKREGNFSCCYKGFKEKIPTLIF